MEKKNYPLEKIKQLREELAEFHNNKIFRECRTMGELVLYNMGTMLNEPDILTIASMHQSRPL